MSGYPIELITNYMAGKISRQQFTKQFSDWQKSRGINYDCKIKATRQGVSVQYRGVTATICRGTLRFFSEIPADKKNGDGKIIQTTAQNVFDFRRKIDLVFCGKVRHAE